MRPENTVSPTTLLAGAAEREFLKTRAAQIFGNEEIALRISGDVVRRDEFAGLPAEAATRAQLGERASVQNQNLVLALVRYVEILLLRTWRKRQRRHRAA